MTATRPLRRSACTLVVAVLPLLAVAADETVPAWTVAGRQGLVQVVIVPVMQAADRAAYDAQAARLCEPERTCFLNFHTNRTGAEVALPLPDAIAAEATATYRRSVKNGAVVFRWSCRIKPDDAGCF